MKPVKSTINSVVLISFDKRLRERLLLIDYFVIPRKSVDRLSALAKSTPSNFSAIFCDLLRGTIEAGIRFSVIEAACPFMIHIRRGRAPKYSLLITSPESVPVLYHVFSEISVGSVS